MTKLPHQQAADETRTSDPRAQGGNIVPMVVKKTAHGERGYDIFSRLLEDRIIFIGSPINDAVANTVIAQMLYLQNENKNQDIHIYIHSMGGMVTSGLAIYDTMQLAEPRVSTYVVGQAYSIAAVLLAGGDEGKRYALPHARIMLHQPWGGMEGTAADISIHADEMVKLEGWIKDILVEKTGQSREKISEDTDREFYLSAEEAVEYGIVDEILSDSGE
ncbi:MAG: ATP-dependent Clp protease proteolytic subunit [Candidatus Brocadiia bacterium]